jgi:hypothetical protein
VPAFWTKASNFLSAYSGRLFAVIDFHGYFDQNGKDQIYSLAVSLILK